MGKPTVRTQRSNVSAIKELKTLSTRNTTGSDSNAENMSPPSRRKRKVTQTMANEVTRKRYHIKSVSVQSPTTTFSAASSRKRQVKKNNDTTSSSIESDSQSQLDDRSNANESLEESKLNESSLSISEIDDDRSKRLLDTTQTPNTSFISDFGGNTSSSRKLRSSRRLMLSAVDANNVETSKSDIDENESACLDSSAAESNINDMRKINTLTFNEKKKNISKNMNKILPIIKMEAFIDLTNEVVQKDEVKSEDSKKSQEAQIEEQHTGIELQTKDAQTENVQTEIVPTQDISETYNNNNNNENENFQTISSIKSPSAVSIDSAKGSSIANESEYGIYATGDIHWGRIHNFSYWACMVCPDDSDDDNLITRIIDQQLEVHVRFFADNARHSWVKRENLIPYQGLESYREHLRDLKDKLGVKSVKYQSYLPKRNKLKTWLNAVREADIISTIPYPERMAKFFALYEVARERNKEERMRRKSLSLIQPVKNLNGNNASEINDQKQNISKKRNRSESPQSPAFSPIREIKRRKTTADATELTKNQQQQQEQEEQQQRSVAFNETPSIKQPKPETETKYNTSADSRGSINNDSLDSPQFRQFHSMIKDFVMQGRESKYVEMNLYVAVKNIWGLKNILQKHYADSQNAIIPADSDQKSMKRLSLRIREMQQQRHNTDNTMGDTTTTTSAATPSTSSQISLLQKTLFEERRRMNSISRTKTRPIEEVIDDIFNLDSRYLFDNMNRDPVCKYCYIPGGDVRRCSKGCLNWLHRECLIEKKEIMKVESTPMKVKPIKKRSIKKESIANSNDINQDHVADRDENDNNQFQLLKSNEATDLKTFKDAVVVAIQEPNNDPVICRECTKNEAPKCFVCDNSKKQYTTTSNGGQSTIIIEEQTILCNTMHCNRVYHPSCLKYWPQAKITKSKNTIVSLRCPSHVCHTCVSDDPKGKFLHISNANTTKCVKCPATYHMDSTCIPAGSEILNASHIICPRHTTTKNDQNVNVSWCFICVRGGQLICCESCPTAVHAECSNTALDANEGYICDECESGRMPLYGEMVWAKFNAYRWWPAIILPPTEVPMNIRSRVHNRFEFVIRFFGTHDHGWISRRRVYLYLEGDWSEPPRTKRGIDQSYLRGVIEAKQAYEIVKAKTLMRDGENENKERLHPQPYVKIRANRAVAPVKLHQNLEKVGKCECNPNDENPCGPDSNCINRVLYHECNPKICPAGERCQNQMFEMRISPAMEIFYTKKERGFGLRSRESIPVGTFIIEYVGEVIDSVEFQRRMHQKSTDRDENYYFLYVEKDYIIDAGPKGNMARFMNHSCNPNCETQKWSVNGLNRVGLFAIKDIPTDTELTFNYHWDELLGNDKKACCCCSENCTGQIGKLSKDDKIKQPSLDEPPSSLNAKSSKSELTKTQKMRKRRKNSTSKSSNQKRGKNDEQVVEKPRATRRKRKAVNATIEPTETSSIPTESDRTDVITENHT